MIISPLWVTAHYMQSTVRCFRNEEAEDSGRREGFDFFLFSKGWAISSSLLRAGAK